MKEKRQKFYFILFVLFFTGLLIFINISKAQELIFSEIMYDPAGSDTGNEWVEIFNNSTSTITISDDYRFNDGSNHVLNLSSGVAEILPDEYFIITTNVNNFLSKYVDYAKTLFQSSFSLGNTSGIIKILQGINLITEQSYSSTTGGNNNGKSIEADFTLGGNFWRESYVSGGTPGFFSNELPINCAPVAIINVSTTTIYIGDNIVFDANSSTDENGDTLTYFWNIDNTASSSDVVFNYNFVSFGEHSVELTVSDGNLSDTEILTINVLENNLIPIIDYSDKLIINELLANPEGSDDTEWIELKNVGQDSINLKNFYIQDSSNKKYIFSENDFENLILDPDEYFVLEYSVSHITLNNSSDKLILFDEYGNDIFEISYASSIEGNSWAKFDDFWQWTEILTPGAENKRKIIYKPEATINFTGDLTVGSDIKFSSLNSYDPNGEDLEYKWYVDNYLKSRNGEFTTSFDKGGLKTIKLLVINDSGLEDEDIKNLEIHETIQSSDKDISNNCSSSSTYGQIVISEVFPNPKGVDDGEFFELYNPGNNEIDLSLFSVNDSSSYFYKLNQKIPAKSYLAIYKSDSKISLNNSNENLKILDCNKNIIWKVEYEKSTEDKSYSYNFLEEEYFWESPTPGLENYFSNQAIEEVSQIESQEELINNEEYSFYGIVISDLNQIKKNIFYVCFYDLAEKFIDYENCFESKLSNTDLETHIGDISEIIGQVKNTDEKNTMKIYEFKTIDNIKLSEPEIYDLEDINNLNLNSFASVSGEIFKVNKKSFYVGTEESKIKIKFQSIGDLKLNKSENVIVRGIVVKDGEEKAIYIRDKNDILIQQVLGEQETATSTQSLNNLENKSNKNNNLIGILIIGVAVLGVGFYFFKNKLIKK